MKLETTRRSIQIIPQNDMETAFLEDVIGADRGMRCKLRRQVVAGTTQLAYIEIVRDDSDTVPEETESKCEKCGAVLPYPMECACSFLDESEGEEETGFRCEDCGAGIGPGKPKVCPGCGVDLAWWMRDGPKPYPAGTKYGLMRRSNLRGQ